MKLNRNLVGFAATGILVIAFSITAVLTNDTAVKTEENTAEQITTEQITANVTNGNIELKEGQPTAGVAAVLGEYEAAATEAVEQVASIQKETIEFVTASDVDEIIETVEEAQAAAVPPMSEEEAAWQNCLMADINSEMNVRAEASTEAEIVGKLHKGDRATVLEQGEEWTKISSGNVEGYVKNEY